MHPRVFEMHSSRLEARKPVPPMVAAVDICLWCGQVDAGLEVREPLNALARRMAVRWGWPSWRKALEVVMEREAVAARFRPKPAEPLDLFGGAL